STESRNLPNYLSGKLGFFPNLRGIGVNQIQKGVEDSRWTLLLPCGDKLEAHVVRLQTVEPNTIRSEISDTRRYNRHSLLGFDHRKHRLHQVELTIDSRKEAGVIAHARNRVEEGRRAFPMKQNETLLGQSAMRTRLVFTGLESGSTAI